MMPSAFIDACLKYTCSRLFFLNLDLLHSSIWLNMFELIIRKPVIVISNQVGHKTGLTDTENGYRVSDVEACGIELFP